MTCGEENLGQGNIRREIFQGDSLSPMLFVVSQLPLTHILRDAASGYHFVVSNDKKLTIYFLWVT